MKTQTETKNFKPVTVSTVCVNGVFETIIFYLNAEIFCTRKVQNEEKQHMIAVGIAEKYTLEVSHNIIGGYNFSM